MMNVLGPAVAAAAGQKHVLVLYSARRDAQLATLGDRDLPRLIQEGLDEDLDYYSEYLDLGRFPDPEYRTGFRDFLRLKYEGLNFELVIAMQDSALEFLAGQRSELFPDTPVVFVANSGEMHRLPNSTGILAPSNFGETVILALQLQPETRNVYVVTGAEDRDKAIESLARTQFRPFEDRLAFTYLSGLPTRELERQLSTLPANSIIYYVLANRDGAGRIVHPVDYVDRIAAVANAPIYCWVSSAMGHGILGGSLKSQELQIEAVSQLALRVLRGERADTIPVTSPQLNVRQVDWRQLRRWNISSGRVPAGTAVLFRQRSAWERYKFYILGAAAVLLAQSVLIGALLVQRGRRRQAEGQASESERRLRNSYHRIGDLAARLLKAQDTERARIARELHDDISQQLAVLEIDLEQLHEAVQADSEELAGEVLIRAQRIARSVHDLSHRLHPAKLRLIGLVAALSALQRELSRSYVSITFAHENVPTTLSPDLTLSLFRIVQEAVQNALKYSRARTVSIELKGRRDALALSISDDGVGFDVDAGWDKGLGLVSMRERAEGIGGTLEIRSGPEGTRLDVTVPNSPR
jgi:signal transduction histidine kinase